MSQPHAQPAQVVQVAPLGAQLASAVTTALYKAQQLEVVRVVLPAGKALNEHTAPGEITLYCLEGLVWFQCGGAPQAMRAGSFVHLAAGAPHSLRAEEDASLLLTLCLARPGPERFARRCCLTQPGCAGRQAWSLRRANMACQDSTAQLCGGWHRIFATSTERALP